MNFISQRESIDLLTELASRNFHSILIDGVMGSGKTWLARKYAELLHIADFQIIEPSATVIRQVVDTLSNLDNPLVICIENLDTGVSAAASAILKFLEEPTMNAYVIVTCRNIRSIPDTIVSRCASVTVSPPRLEDVNSYAEWKDSEKYRRIHSSKLWECATSFADASTILSMTSDQLAYYDELKSVFNSTAPITEILWKLGHYPDDTDTPTTIVVEYLKNCSTTTHQKMSCIRCVKELSSARVATHATLAKLLFELKYCE